MAEEEEEAEEARPPGLCCGWGEDGGRLRCGEEGGSEPSLSPWLLLGGVGGSWRASSKRQESVERVFLIKNVESQSIFFLNIKKDGGNARS